MPNPTEEYQQVQDISLVENLNILPPRPRSKWVGNIVTRTWSVLFGKGTSNLVPLSCTDSGELIVAPTGTGVQFTEVYEGSVDNTQGLLVHTFVNLSKTVNIIANDNDFQVQTSPDGITYGELFTIKGGTIFAIDAVVKAIKFQTPATKVYTATFEWQNWY